ncbi:hypothetical protein IG631_12283 [Alternaria alternata]|jgi:hypothetical protein|nr:hypothetical protein IG631_12283 [Alternaria alternata]
MYRFRLRSSFCSLSGRLRTYKLLDVSTCSWALEGLTHVLFGIPSLETATVPGGPRVEVAILYVMCDSVGVGGEELPAEKRGQAKMFGDVHGGRRGLSNATAHPPAKYALTTFTI